ncbi:hypothetical protein D3C80_2152420 [compost metagenome]
MRMFFKPGDRADGIVDAGVERCDRLLSDNGINLIILSELRKQLGAVVADAAPARWKG